MNKRSVDLSLLSQWTSEQTADEKMVELGRTNIKEFGIIIDWPYETE